jgi:hypothetical protein
MGSLTTPGVLMQYTEAAALPSKHGLYVVISHVVQTHQFTKVHEVIRSVLYPKTDKQPKQTLERPMDQRRREKDRRHVLDRGMCEQCTRQENSQRYVERWTR